MDLFTLPGDIWKSFRENFTEQIFIFGFTYDKGKKKTGWLLNFFSWSSKVGNLSRKHKINKEQNA